MFTLDSCSGLFKALARGDKCEVDSEVFDHFLEMLPPVFMGRRVELCDGATVYAIFGYAEGASPVEAFWREGKQFFAQRSVLRVQQ